MTEPVRSLPIMWSEDGATWKVRVVLDHGKGSERNGHRYTWEDGDPLERGELERVARVLEAGGFDA